MPRYSDGGIITPFDLISPVDANQLGVAMSLGGTSFSIATTNVTKTIYVPILIHAPVTAYALWTEVGTTVGSGSQTTMALYDETLTRILAPATAATTGPNTVQYFDTPDTVLTRGTYYVASHFSAATSIRGFIIQSSGVACRMIGIWEQAGAPPASPTFASFTSTMIPIQGILARPTP